MADNVQLIVPGTGPHLITAGSRGVFGTTRIELTPVRSSTKSKSHPMKRGGFPISCPELGTVLIEQEEEPLEFLMISRRLTSILAGRNQAERGPLNGRALTFDAASLEAFSALQ